MSAKIRQFVVAACIVAVLSVVAPAGTVFEQLPNRTGGQASDTEFLQFATGTPFWQLEADNVQVSASTSIRHITWWGFYGDDFDESPDAHDPPSGDETMRIRFYASRPTDGLPDSSSILFEESFLNPSRLSTGSTVAVGTRPPEYEYEVDLGSTFLLEADLLYWLEIAQIGDHESHYRWERGNGVIPGRSFSNPVVPDWRATTGSFAFALSTVPEPGTGSLLLCVSMLSLIKRRGRKARRA